MQQVTNAVATRSLRLQCGEYHFRILVRDIFTLAVRHARVMLVLKKWVAAAFGLGLVYAT